MDDTALREHLLDLLRGGGAHLSLDRAVAEMPAELRGVRPDRLPYSPWEQLEHLRLAQWDIVAFSSGDDHTCPPWPDGYWPDGPAPPSDDAWDQSIESIRRDNQRMQDMVQDPDRKLLEPLPWGDGQTLAREAMLIADHTGYHLGQLIVIRRLLGAWGGLTGSPRL